MKYKRRIIISIILGVTGLILLIIFAVPKFVYQFEIKKLENEILEVRSSLKKINFNKDELINNMTSNIFRYSGKDLEQKVENNLKSLINITYDIFNIDYTNFLSKDNVDSLTKRNDTLENITNIKKLLIDNKEKCNKLIEENNNYLDKKELNSLLSSIDEKIDSLDYIAQVINYLNSSSDFYINDNNFVFTKKKSFLEYKEILNYLENKNMNIINSKIENDDIAPIITPKKLDVFVGANSLNGLLKCIDEIDGEVECKISGNYKLDVIGNYNISVEAMDNSNNYVKKNIELNVIERVSGPYYTEIIRNQNTIIVYGLDDNKQYTKIVKVFVCSTGRGGRTPIGTFYTTKGAPWGLLMGGVWGQYYTMITPSILFHSVPYYSMSKDNLEWQEYNKLGSEASAGCVRLSTIDAKWIYDNCPSGMRVRIYDGELPNGVIKPTPIKIDPNSPFKGWDPTDPDINNPWNKQ